MFYIRRILFYVYAKIVGKRWKELVCDDCIEVRRGTKTLKHESMDRIDTQFVEESRMSIRLKAD